MAILTLTYVGKLDGSEQTVTRTATIMDEQHADYLDAQLERINLQAPGKPRPSDLDVVEKHLEFILHELNMVFSAHVNRKQVNAFIATLPTARLK